MVLDKFTIDRRKHLSTVGASHIFRRGGNLDRYSIDLSNHLFSIGALDIFEEEGDHV